MPAALAATAPPETAGRFGDAAAARLVGAVRRYRGGRAVGPVDLRVEAGEVLAIMGPNGAGKSTVLRLLATADRPDAGLVAWWGREERGWARRRIGYAPDQPQEEESLSARQATSFWCAQWVSDRDLARALAGEALAGLGLAERADEPVGTLSFGLRRRLSIAQALAHRPALALLDEPSAGLDPHGCAILAGALRERVASGGAVVVASNDPEFVAAAADRVALLHEGRCRRVAPLAVLLDELPRRRIVDLQLATGGREPAAGTDGAPAAAVTIHRIELVPGVTAVTAGPHGLRVELEEQASLAALVAAADAAGGGLRSVQVRRPDLRDCFPSLVGMEGGE
jgi:ABC-2 type transport system ATP-binding protein